MRNALLNKRRSLGWLPSYVAFVALVLLGSRSDAAELRLHPEVRTAKSLLHLGDVAEISAADPQAAERLAAVELIPSPPPGEKRYLSLREIQDVLSLRGVNLAECQFSGASHVTVTTALNDSGASGPGQFHAADQFAANHARRPARVLVQQAQRLADEAIVRRLKQESADPENWQVSAELDDSQVPTIVAATDTIVAEGGQQPWLGRQQFGLNVPTADGPARLRIAARVSLPPAVVVTVHDVLKGSVVRDCDVELLRLRSGQSPGEAYQTIADVVGKEAVRSLPAGQPLDRNLIRAPLLVCSGEVVTVVGRNAGIVVRMPARARENGGRGDLVNVESLLDRKTFLARVTELHEVEVFAGASTTSPDESSGQTAANVPAAGRGFIRRVSADVP